MPALMLLQGQTAVISGCNRGIGKAILAVFAQHGADVFACVRQESEEFTRSIHEVATNTGVSITPVYFDFADAEQVKAGARTITGSKKKVDILVNNAGIASGSLLQMTSMQEMKRLFEVNFFSQVLFTQMISRCMVRHKSGSIINIASTAGLLGDTGTIGYGSSKAALIFATKTMATELGEANIRVNAIAPSVTKTEMYNQMDEAARNKLIESSILKRAAEPSEIANVALFLASSLSSYITGQVLRVDGGLTK